ncbi:MAG: HD domain-containing protein [Candidatus Bathyarchaeia archaeon]|jgi:uncharacterized protein
MVEETLAKMRKEIRNSTLPSGTHGYEHIDRVYSMCLHIGKIEGADMRILLPAALLHDLAREEQNHAEVGAEKAKPILQRYGYSPDDIEKITNAISTHSFSGNKSPETLEGEILSDADKLDALGALGVYRTAVYSGENARPIDEFVAHFYEKLLKLEGLVFTAEAKRIARDRTEYLCEFINRLGQELKQEF